MTKEQTMDLLYTVKDPEINASIVDIGLIYNVTIEGEDVDVLITLTSPQCPLGPEIIRDIENTLRPYFDIVNVDITFDPPWDPSRFSEELRLEYGYPI